MQFKEEALFTLKYDGKPVINELGELEKRLQDVKEAQKSVERGTKEWADNKAEIKQLEASIKQVREEMGVSGMTVRQLEGYYRQLNREIKDLTPGTDAYIQKAAQLTEVNTALADHRQTVRGVNEEVEKLPSLWERAKAGVMVFFAAFGAMELLQRAFSFVQDGIKSALALSDQMGAVAKATGQSTQEVQALSDELNKIDTRTTKESLMDIAQIGGQLGVANEELLGFIQSTDMAAVALGDEFSGGAEEAASKLGGLKKLFNQTDELTYGVAIQRIGSAINELGADGSATGPVIAEFTARLGQLGDLSPQITETMGLGAAFQELGLSAEISAGGLSNILLTAAKDTASFAQQIGVTDAEMKRLINTDPNTFLLKLADSFKGVPADQLAMRLDDLGIKSQEATKVMSLLKDQTELVRDKQLLANKAFEEGSSLQQEFNTVNQTAAAEYAKSQKALTLIATEIGQGLLPAITTGTRGIVTFVNVLRGIPDFVSENRTSFAALGLAILSFNGHLIAATATSIAHAAAEKGRLIWTQSATAAQWLLNTAMTANPIGAVVAAVALLVAGFTALYNNSTTVRGVINGVWEAMKTGATLVGELTDIVLDFLQRAVEPLEPAFDTLGSILSAVWSALRLGAGYVSELHSSFVSFISNGLSRMGVALEPVRAGLANFWSLIDTGITKIKSIGSTIATFLHVDEVVSKVKSAAGLIGDAFNKGYGDQLEADRPKQLAAHQQHLATKKTAEQKGANDLADIVTASDQKALDKKAAQAEKHRAAEAKKAADAAQKEAEEMARANAEGLKKVELARIAAITDELEREKAKLQLKHTEELAHIEKSKASQQVKAVWEKALNEQLQRDIDKAEDDHRTKKEKEEAETAKRVLDLKIKLSGDEKADKLQKLEDVATAQRAQVQKDVTDQTERARLFKQINDNLTRDTEQVNAEFRRREQEANNTLRDAEHAAKLAALNRDEAEAGTNAQRLLQIKKTRLDTEYDHFRLRLRQERDEELERIANSNMSQQQKAAAQKAINDKYLADVKASIVQHTNETNQIDQEDTERRRARRQEFFSAIKSMMDGDFTAFTDILTKKLAGENKQLTESQKKQIATIDEVGSYAVMATQALQKLSQMKLDKELANIKREKDTQLASWKEKYDKGVISKEEYEENVDRINKEADRQTKEAQLNAFRRQQKLDIAMALINAAQAALKSLATLGWPLGLIGVAAAGVAAAIQIKAIKAQQPPSMEKGGTIRNAGVPEGPRHGRRYGESGIALVRRDNGEEVGEMEGQEPIMVLSRNTYANNRRVVDSLLHSSLHRNGAPIMLNGGLIGNDGGTYGDYLRRGRSLRRGGLMFENGGWMDEINNDYQEGGYTDSGGGGGVVDEGGSVDTASADSMNSLTNEQIEKSQALMESIEENTALTVEAVKLMVDTVKTLAEVVKLESTNQSTALAYQFTGLRTELRERLDLLQTNATQDHAALRLALASELEKLQTTMKFEFPTLGKDLIDELSMLRLSMGLGLLNLRLGLDTSLTSLEKTTQTGLEDLGQLMHDDLLTLTTTTETELTSLQTNLRTDLDTLTLNVHTDLDTLADNMHTDLESLKLAQALQLLQLRTETKTNFTTLQTILKTELERLQQATHTDLTSLQGSNQSELQTIQSILNRSNGEQGYQSALLRIISEKNLSVSVQSIAQVFNQVNVVVDQSNFK